MDKVKNFLSKYGQEMLYIAFLGLFFAFAAINLFLFEINETEVGLNFYQFLVGGTYYGVAFQSNNILLIILVVIALALVCYITSRCTKNKQVLSKYMNGISLFLNLFAFVMLLLSNLLSKDFLPESVEGIKDSFEYNDLGIILLVITLASISAINLRNVFDETKFKTRDIVEIAMLVSLSIVLDKFASIDIGATGGSFNFSGIPLLILCLRHGPVKGLIASSVVFGLLTCLIDGYGIQTYPFDYLIAFSGYALCGVVMNLMQKFYDKNQKSAIITILVATFAGAIGVFITRMIGSTISSMVFYKYEIGPALAYNVLYIGPSAAICFAAVALLSYPIYRINVQFPNKK